MDLILEFLFKAEIFCVNAKSRCCSKSWKTLMNDSINSQTERIFFSIVSQDVESQIEKDILTTNHVLT